jgi:S-adenosylmethionine decarboxylase proenzyme
MNTHGRHLLLEYMGCPFDALNDVGRIRVLMEAAAQAAKMTIVASVFQPFEPQGVSGVVVVEESHLSIHTWPEHGMAAVDLYTCGDGDPEAAHDVLKVGLQAEQCEQMLVERGRINEPQSMTLLWHTYEGPTSMPAPATEPDAASL